MSPITSFHRQSIQTQLHLCFHGSLLHTFEETEKIFLNYHAKDLQYSLPQILESFFNFDGSCPDELNFGRITSENSYEFEVARRFFGLNSPLMSLVVKLTSDPACHNAYEFPFAHLPLATRNSIMSDRVPSFYSSKLKLNSTGTAVEAVLLDAFDLYMFHFVYYITNPHNWKVVHMIGEKSLRNDWIYTSLVNSYLNAFFPPSPDLLPIRIERVQQRPFNLDAAYSGAANASRTGRGYSPHVQQQLQCLSGSFQQILPAGNAAMGIYQQQQHLKQPANYFLPNFVDSHPSSPLHVPVQSPKTSPPPRISRLLKINPRLVSQLNCSPTDPTDAVAAANVCFQGDRVEASDAVLQIFVDFWLNQFDASVLEQQFWLTNKMLKMEDFLLLVRVLVKHLHLFANSALVDCRGGPSAGARDGPTAGYISPSFSSSFVKNITPIQQQHLQLQQNSNIVTQEQQEWNEFKRNIWSPWLCSKLYNFLKYHFVQGPLERPLVEIWLSFIQPWRYIGMLPDHPSLDSPRHSPNPRDAERIMDGRWASFVKRHLLFYVVFLELLVDRLLPLDFTSHGNSVIFNRVAKVYSIRNLKETIEEAEMFLESNGFDNQSCSTSFHDNGRYLPGNQKTLIAELVGDGFQFKPLFSKESKAQVLRLISNVLVAKENLENQAISFQMELNKKSLLQRLTSMLSSNDKLKLHAIEKTIDQLAISANQFLIFFECPLAALPQLPIPTWSRRTTSRELLPEISMDDRCTAREVDSDMPDVQMRDDGSLVLTPLGRHEIITKRKKFDLVYRGNPDLQPIRSFECAPVVRFLYKLCDDINRKYSREIIRATEKPSFPGWLARQIFRGVSVTSSNIPLRDRITPHDLNTPRRRLNLSASDLASPPKPVLSARSMPANRQDGTPCLSLRFLAKYSNLFLVLFILLSLKFWLGLDLMTVFLLFGVLVMTCVMAVSKLILSCSEEFMNATGRSPRRDAANRDSLSESRAPEI